VEISREGIPLLVIQRQLGHADLPVTSTYLRGIETPRSATGSPSGPHR
jgi:integrase